MITITGNGLLTRDVELRSTHSGKTVATISVASDRRDHQVRRPGRLRAPGRGAAEHLVKGQAP